MYIVYFLTDQSLYKCIILEAVWLSLLAFLTTSLFLEIQVVTAVCICLQRPVPQDVLRCSALQLQLWTDTVQYQLYTVYSTVLLYTGHLSPPPCYSPGHHICRQVAAKPRVLAPAPALITGVGLPGLLPDLTTSISSLAATTFRKSFSVDFHR